MHFMSLLALQENLGRIEPTGIGVVGWTVISIVAIGIIINPWAMLFFCTSQRKECEKTKKKYWNQLLLWRDRWQEMQQWIGALEMWMATHCDGPIPDGVGDPPKPPTWPNGNPNGNGEE